MPNDATKTGAVKRVLVISEDPEFALALRGVFSAHGIVVRCEHNPTEAVLAIRDFRPDAMVTASATTVFLSRRSSQEIIDLVRPVDPIALLRFLQPRASGEASQNFCSGEEK